MDTSVTFEDADGTKYVVRHPMVETMVNGVWLQEPMTMEGFLRTCLPLPYEATNLESKSNAWLHEREREIVTILPLWANRRGEDDVEYYQYLVAEQRAITLVLNGQFPDIANEVD